LNKRAINHRHTLGKLLRYWPFIIALIVTSLASLPPAETALAQFSDVGYRDHRMGSNCVSAPTGEKPESKLWWHDGTWWGNLCHSDGNFHIYRLNMATQTWEDTGVAVDNRKSDALMDPATNKLYIVTHVFSTSATPQTCPSQCGRLYRFSYNASSRIFTLDSGFPVTVTGGRAEAVVLAKDSTGQLWVTYVENRRVMVNRSLGSDTNWGTPFQLPSSSAAGNVSSDDISSIVAFQGKIGVMWSNQNTDKFYFAIHNDNDDDMTWQTEEVAAQGNGIADDHISLQADSSGRVFAAVKTSTDPLNLMLVRQPNGQWSTHVFGTDADSHTRPILVVDSVNGRVHYFATSGQSGGAIYYKSTSTTNPSFPPGKGEIFISHSSSTRINNPTSMKSNVSPTTGLVVAASDSNYYYHNFLSLGGSQPPTVTATATTTTPTATPTTTTPTATATTTGTPGPVMTFSPTDDSWVRSTSPSSNYGSQDTVRVRLTASETINTYLKFNLSGITGPVQGAKLRLFVADDSPSGGSIYLVSNNLAGSSTPWTESTIRWNNAPPVSGTPLDTAGTATTGTWVEFDVSAAITGNGIYSFAIANGSTNSVLYNSKEAASNRPELVIQVGGGGSTPTATTTATATATQTPTATPTTTTPTATATTTGTPGPVMTFSPTDDSWVRSTSPSSNYGSQDTVRVRLTASETINTYLKFNLSGITGPVQGAKLRLFVADDSPSGGSIYLVSNNLAGSSTPWTESTIRWNNAPPVSGTPLDTAGTATTGTWVEFDVSAAITGNGIYSFAIANGSTNSVLYNSKEAASNRPELVIQVGGGGSTPTATTTATATATQTPTATTTATGTPSDPGGGTQLTFGATDDTQVKSSKPTSNYGSLTSLRVRFTSSEIINSYLKFNVTGTGGSVSSAILRLYVTDDSPDGGSIYLVSNNLAGSTTPWTESNINWNNAPPFSGSPLDSAGPVAAGVWVEFDVTAAITEDGVYSFALTSNSSNSALFEASEAASNQPQLVVTIGNGPSSGAAAQSAINTATPTDTDTPTATITPEPPPASPTSSAQIAFSPSDDAQVKSDSPDRNYGSLPSLRARTASSDIIGSYLKFNITGLTGAPSQAILRLYVADASPDSGSIYLVSNDLRDGSAPWTEGTITWNNAPAYGGTPVASSVEAIEGSWVYFDVTEAITGNGIYSFALFSNHSNSVLYNSKEAGENGPLLIIETGESVQTGALQTFSLPATEAVELENPAPQMMLALQDQPEEHLDALDDGQIIESDSGLVVLSPGWVPVSAPGASGSTFVVNTSPDDSLTFNFSGTRIEIGYVAGEAFAPFVIQVDGQQIQTVAGGGQPEFQFHQRAVVDGLSEGLHTLQILPQNGVVAIDYFVTFVPPAPIVVAQANQEPQMVETIEAEPPPVETIDQMLPTSDPIVVLEPPVIVEMPTATPTPVAIPLPVYAGGPDSFDIAGAWRLSDDGQRWHVDGFDTSVLSLRFPLDLRGAQYPAVQFQSWLNANNASAGLQMSLDGQTWNMLTIMLPANDWQPLTIDLSLFKGQVIWLRWVWLPQPPVENDPIADFWELQSIMVIDLPPATPTDTPTGIPTEIPTLELPVVPTFPVIVTEEVTAPPEPQLPTEVLPTPAPVEPEPTLEEIQPEQPESGGDQEPETLPEQAPQNTIDNAPGNAEATEAVPAG